MVLNDIRERCKFLLWNPTTMDKIQLPPLDIDYHSCVLSSAPGDPTCTLLLISFLQKNVLTFSFCSPQKNSQVISWNKQEVKFNEVVHLRTIVFCRGKIYAYAEFGNKTLYDILIIEVVNDTVTVIKMGVHPLPRPRDELYSTRIMTESCGEQYVIRQVFAEYYMPCETINFQVFKLDFATLIWEPVENLGNQAFFIDFAMANSFTVPSEESESQCGITGNTIYFTMPHGNSLYAFNLGEKSITVSLTCPKLKHNWYGPDWYFL